MKGHACSRGLWEQSAPKAPMTGCLEESISADVVVIGAGFTGLSAALHPLGDPKGVRPGRSMVHTLIFVVPGNGHSLTPDNLKVDHKKRRSRCRHCGRARAAEFRARHRAGGMEQAA